MFNFFYVRARTDHVYLSCRMPLHPESPTDTSVQYSVLKQLEKVHENIVGPGKKLVITADLGLFKPLKKLQMAFLNQNWVIIPGDLHIIMAALRTIGNYIELTSIPELWIESGIFTDVTVHHLLDGKPIRRSCKIHITTLHVMFTALLEEFLTEHKYLEDKCKNIQTMIWEAWQKKNSQSIQLANQVATEEMENLQLYVKLKEFCEKISEKNPPFKMALNYMDMVFTLMSFMRAVRSADWKLRLSSLEDLTKYFFAMKLPNYSAFCAWHIAEMNVLAKSDSEVWTELERGKWAPNKSGTPFCHLGADEALEQENRLPIAYS